MTEPRKVYPGERLPGYPSAAHNLFFDTAKKVQGLPDAIFQGLPVAPGHALALEVKNATGGDLTADRPIVKIDGPLFDYDDNAKIIDGAMVASGAAPAGGDEVGQWGVADGPVADGASVAVTISGHAWCQVNVTNAAHTHASPAAGDTDKLVSGTSGVRMMWKQSGTGTKWAWVYLGGGAGDSADIIYARVNNTGGTSADTNLYNYDSGVSITGCVTAASTGQFRNNGQTIDDNQWVILVKRQDTGEYEPEQVGGEATGNVIYAQVNEGSGVTSASGTFAFDNAIAIVGTSPGTGTATNVHSQKYANNEWLLLYQRKSDNAWVTGRRPAAIFTGTAYAGFAEGDANLQVESLTAIWGEVPTTDPLTVANTLKLTGATGDAVLCVENDDGSYLAVNNEHRIIEWLKDQSGYDAGETQYFRHVSGTPGWVDSVDTVLFFCQPTANVTGGSSFTADNITQVLGTPPSGPSETIKNTLGYYVDADDWVLAVKDYLGEYEAVAVENYAPAWLRAQSGYNGSNNQVFHHDAGVFKWGDYGTCS